MTKKPKKLPTLKDVIVKNLDVIKNIVNALKKELNVMLIANVKDVRTQKEGVTTIKIMFLKFLTIPKPNLKLNLKWIFKKNSNNKKCYISNLWWIKCISIILIYNYSHKIIQSDKWDKIIFIIWKWWKNAKLKMRGVN